MRTRGCAGCLRRAKRTCALHLRTWRTSRHGPPLCLSDAVAPSALRREAIAFGSNPPCPYQSRLEPLCQDIARAEAGRRLRGAAHRRRGARPQAANRAGRAEHLLPPPRWTATSSRGRYCSCPCPIPSGVREPACVGCASSAIPTSTALPTSARARSRPRASVSPPFTDLRAGDYVVHDLHGAGLFLGRGAAGNDGAGRDYLLIQYAGNDKALRACRPVRTASPSSSAPKTPSPARTLGGQEERQKTKVKSGLEAGLLDLAELYAR